MMLTLVGLIIPNLIYDSISMFIAFSFIGIGNTIMQVSLNPLLANMVNPDKQSSFLTLGQFVKAIASAIAPILAAKAGSLLWKLEIALCHICRSRCNCYPLSDEYPN